MPELAKLIVVDIRAHTVTIDGTVVPWFLSDEWSVTEVGLPRLNVAILAETIEVTS